MKGATKPEEPADEAFSNENSGIVSLTTTKLGLVLFVVAEGAVELSTFDKVLFRVEFKSLLGEVFWIECEAEVGDKLDEEFR